MVARPDGRVRVDLSAIDDNVSLPEPYQSSFLNALQEVSPRQANKTNLPVTNEKGPWWVEVLWNEDTTTVGPTKWVRSFAHQHFTKSGHATLEAAWEFASQIDGVMFEEEWTSGDGKRRRFRVHLVYNPGGPPPPTTSYVQVYGLE